MLVLTRKLMEKLFIGDDICVTVVRLEGGQVRLGIDAPRHVSVVRAELVPEREARHDRATVIRSHINSARPNSKQAPSLVRGTDSRRPGRSR
jgi:carbon storage regulator